MCSWVKRTLCGDNCNIFEWETSRAFSGGFEEVQTSHLLAIMDIIRIPPGICSKNIQLMPDHKPSIEHQRRLNPPMKEVVKK